MQARHLRLTYYFGHGPRRFYPFVSGLVLFEGARTYADGQGLTVSKLQDRQWELSAGAVVLMARNVGIDGELYYAHDWSREKFAAYTGVPATTTRSANYGIQFGVSVFVY